MMWNSRILRYFMRAIKLTSLLLLIQLDRSLADVANNQLQQGQQTNNQQTTAILNAQQLKSSTNINNSNFVLNQVNAAPQINKFVDSSTTQTTNLQFGNEDPIIYLDYSSLSEEILGKRTANFVYFNANFSSCRNCDKFFSIWRELAVDLRWWRQVVKLFAINCSEEDNIEICRRAGVTQFPQLKYYWIMSNSLDQDGQRMRVLGKSVHAMRHLITDRILESYVEHNKLLSQRNQGAQAQRTSPQSQVASNTPAGLQTNLITALTGSNSPFASLIQPMLTQLMGSSSSSAFGKSGGSTSLPLGSLLNSIGGLQGISQLMGAFGPVRRQLNLQPLPSNWPDLEQLEAQDSEQLINWLPLNPERNLGALLIMETQEFLYTGLEVMLDLNPYSNQTYIARVRDEQSRLSKNLTRRDDIRAPVLIYISPLREPRLIMTAPKYTSDEDLRRAFVRMFEKRQVKYPVKRVWSTSVRQQVRAPDSQDDEELLNRLHQVHMGDLMNALRSSLMEQVFRHPELTDDQYNALVKYIYTLINYFPFNSDEGLPKFLRHLHTWLQNQVSPVDVSEYKKLFHDVDEVLPRREWYACKSLTSSKSIPNRSRKPGLFEDPSQLGKVVSNLTRLFRNQQKQGGKLLGLFNALSSGGATTQSSSNGKTGNNSAKAFTTQSTSKPSTSSSTDQSSSSNKREDSPIERIFKSLTSGSLGSDSSILRLISSALTGSSGADHQKESTKFSREYPCGVWKLAHVLVCNEFIKDSPRRDVRHIVIQSLYQYMVNFYACATCGNRVSDVSNEFRIHLDEHLHDQGDSVLLVWKMHNRVSKRLESEIRPGSPTKQQFPTEQLCPKCRAPRAQTDLASSTPNWHDKQVLLFLVHHYRPLNILNDGSNGTSTSVSYQNFPSGLLIVLLVIFVSLYNHKENL